MSDHQNAGKASGISPSNPGIGETRPESITLAAAGRTKTTSGGEMIGEREELTPERVVEIRKKIAAGAYAGPEAAEAVARRILELGDL